MKLATDLEQSKKLAKILPLKSADMFYLAAKGEPIVIGNKMIAVGSDDWDALGEPDVPAWSLSALLDVLPLGLYDEFDNCDYELEINMIDKMPRYIRLGDIYHSQFPYDFEKDTLLDNIVESIIWLNDNNYFE